MKSAKKSLLEFREKPLLDCLMKMRNYIGIKLMKIKKIPRILASFVVKVGKDGELSVECSFDLDNPGNSWSCEYFDY